MSRNFEQWTVGVSVPLFSLILSSCTCTLKRYELTMRAFPSHFSASLIFVALSTLVSCVSVSLRKVGSAWCLPLTRAGPASAECPPGFLQTLWWRSSPSLVQITPYFPVVSRRPDEDWKATGNAALMLANKTNQPNTNLEGKLQCDKKKF